MALVIGSLLVEVDDNLAFFIGTYLWGLVYRLIHEQRFRLIPLWRFYIMAWLDMFLLMFVIAGIGGLLSPSEGRWVFLLLSSVAFLSVLIYHSQKHYECNRARSWHPPKGHEFTRASIASGFSLIVNLAEVLGATSLRLPFIFIWGVVYRPLYQQGFNPLPGWRFFLMAVFDFHWGIICRNWMIHLLRAVGFQSPLIFPATLLGVMVAAGIIILVQGTFERAD